MWSNTARFCRIWAGCSAPGAIVGHLFGICCTTSQLARNIGGTFQTVCRPPFRQLVVCLMISSCQPLQICHHYESWEQVLARPADMLFLRRDAEPRSKSESQRTEVSPRSRAYGVNFDVLSMQVCVCVGGTCCLQIPCRRSSASMFPSLCILPDPALWPWFGACVATVGRTNTRSGQG